VSTEARLPCVPLLMATSELLWLNCSRERMSRLVFCDLHVSVPFMLQKHETGGGGITRLCSPQLLLLVLCIFQLVGF
jgi:hypothetical protein